MNIDWDNLNMWLYGVASALVGFAIVLIRKVFTNERQIELLKQKLDLQEAARQDRHDNLQSQLTEMRTDIKILMREGRVDD